MTRKEIKDSQKGLRTRSRLTKKKKKQDGSKKQSKAHIKPRKSAFKFELPIYYQQSKRKKVLLSLNWFRNVYHYTNNACKKHFHELVEELTKGIRFVGKVRVHYDIYVARKNTDGGNVQAVVEKYMLDGLVNSGAIESDTVDFVVGSSSNYYVDKERPRVEVTIKPVKK